ANPPDGPGAGIEPARGHVDRAESAVRGVVGGAELGRPPAGQRLALIAPGEERELSRVALADAPQPLGRETERLVPFDLREVTGAALANPLERLGQARRRVVL